MLDSSASSYDVDEQQLNNKLKVDRLIDSLLICYKQIDEEHQYAQNHMEERKRKYISQNNETDKKRKRVTTVTNEYIKKSDFNGFYVSLQFQVKDREMKSFHIPENVKVKLEEVRKIEHCKIQFGIHAEFEKNNGSDEEEYDDVKEWSWSYKAVEYSEDFLEKVTSKANEEIQTYSELSSGWKIRRILELRFILVKFS